MKKLNPTDLGFLLFESRQTPQHVANLSIYTAPQGRRANEFVGELIQDYRHVNKVYPPFNQVLRYPPLKAGTPGWVEDDEFDLDFHLRHSSLPKPGNMKQLEILVSRLHATLLDRERPMWEMHVIEGLEKNRFAIYCKMHHALIDGVGGMRLMESVMSTDPEKGKLPFFAVPPRSKKKMASGTVPQISSLIQSTIEQAASQAKTVAQVTQAFTRLAKEARKTDKKLGVPYAAPASMLNTKITGQRRFTVAKFDMERIKKLGKKLGGTLNDVIMAMCAGALREYLEEHDDLPDKPLIGQVPVSVRPADGESTGNAISFLLCVLATDMEDPLERFARIHDSMSEGKKFLQGMSREAIMNYTSLGFLPYSIGQITRRPSTRRPMFNVVISNVPGPRRHLYMHGAHLVELYAVSLLFHGQALNITITSYVDSLDIALIGCRDALPGIARLAEYLDHALLELEKAARRKKKS